VTSSNHIQGHSPDRIHALPLHLANQIAAGEVIERPASVLKELVENSIDAGANQLDIKIEGAGSKLIKVTDNGKGIHPDDLALALSRHATSKLHSSEQLSQIASLGFRGEALPSITSVSQLTLSSHQKGNELAWQIQGETSQINPISHPYGTSIEVRDLFFNLPARRHFLRSNKTEQHHILTTLYRLALSRFDIAFNCHFSDNKTLSLPIATTEQQQLQRINKIAGKSFSQHLLAVNQSYNDIKLSGWIVKAEAHRPQTDVQYFFINGRVIRDRVINHAIKQAYSAVIPAGRQAAYVLYLTIPLDRVDINVHPTKHEVRFRDARLIHGLINRAIEDALIGDQNIEVSNKKEATHSIAEQADLYQSKKQTYKPTINQHNKPKVNHNISLLHQRYALIYSNETPLLIDLQAAEYDFKTRQLQAAIVNNSLRSRPILVPIKMMVDNELSLIAQRYFEVLNKIGINIEKTDNTLLIKTIPALLTQVDIQSLIYDLLLSLKKNKTEISQIITILNQHFPKNSSYSLEQAMQVLQQLGDDLIDNSWCFPLDKSTLTRLF